MVQDVQELCMLLLLVNLHIYCGDFNISGTAEGSTHAVV